MAKWIFLEDFDLTPKLTQSINLDFVVNIILHSSDSELVIFIAAGEHVEPHVLKFQSQEQCQSAYDKIKLMLKTEK